MSTTTTGPLPGAPFDDRKRIEELMQKTGRELLTVDFKMLPELEQQRHRPFIYLLMGLVRHFWNGNRFGVNGDYPYRPKQKTGQLIFDKGEEYKGHNIAAIAVDGNDKVIDFDFNHNTVFRSSMEHAEARLLRRIFSLTGLRSGWSLGDQREEVRDEYSTSLGEVTIYTSLEPCAQCAGIMALARIKEVVYLQADDGAMRVANVIYNLQPYSAKLKPIQGWQCGVDFGTRLADAYEEFKRKAGDANALPFYAPFEKSEKPERSTSLATFLCTDVARDIFDEGSLRLAQLGLNPERNDGYGEGVETRLTRPEVLADIKAFFAYATKGGHRGTAH